MVTWPLPSSFGKAEPHDGGLNKGTHLVWSESKWGGGREKGAEFRPLILLLPRTCP